MKLYMTYMYGLALLVLWAGCSKNQPFNKEQVVDIIDKVVDYQLETFTCLPTGEKGNHHDYGIDSWTNGVFYFGLSRWAGVSAEPSHRLDWLMKTGAENNWAVAANFSGYPKYLYYHADELCIGQFYLDMYDRFRDDAMLAAIKERADWIIAHPGDTAMNFRNKQSWSWCDALFMAPPVYAHLAKITDSPAYLAYMHENFLRAYTHLYDPEEQLFFRDNNYFDKYEENGEKIFWGRGNGWVLAGLANILEQLPSGSALRPFYEDLFRELAATLSRLQDNNGFWHASLLDPDSYPSPETSSTALITYGLAYGVNNGLLDERFLPVVRRAWDALVSVVDDNGKLGWVQPIGADPKTVTREMTAVYGVGAFLMAGTEILKLSDRL